MGAEVMNITATFDGDDWQAFILQVLYIKYGADLIEVPDKHKGDGGIESFALDGCAFQCYAPESPVSTAETAKAHKKKISKDVKKFCENRALLKKRFGNTKIRRWILVVPDHCSADVVAFCQQKTSEVLNLAEPLPYIDTEDFQILTVNGHHYLAKEIAELTRAGGLLVEAEIPETAPEEVETFLQGHDEWIENLDTKLKRLPANDSTEREQLKGHLLQRHLEGGNAIAYYDSNYPVISDRVRSIKAIRAKALEIDCKLKSITIAATREAFEKELVDSVPALGRETALTLSYASIAEWLMVCPLDPKG